jgi:aerobic-type carbon monoxide dehydrogenase small subunit (CoxS/CutS family)
MNTKALSLKPLSFTVNGAPVGPIEVSEGLSLNDVLQEYLGLTGCRTVCGMGVCSACTVIVDSDEGSSELQSCITPAHAMQGRAIRTIEGHARKDGARKDGARKDGARKDGARKNGDGAIDNLSDVQQAFLRHFSFQCGYCTPGFVAAATVLLERVRKQPIARDEVDGAVAAALEPHLCRCTGYVRYYAAVKELVLAQGTR